MENRKVRGGYTLIEIMVSGVILMILTFMMAQGLAISVRIRGSSREVIKAQQKLEQEIELGHVPAGSETFTIQAEGLGDWEVVVDLYEEGMETQTALYVVRDIDRK